MRLHNYMEDIVCKYLEQVLDKHNNICKCKKCKLDIMAIALNNLTPLYTVTGKGKLFSKVKGMEKQFEADIVKEITKAIIIVSNSPQHDI